MKKSEAKKSTKLNNVHYPLKPLTNASIKPIILDKIWSPDIIRLRTVSYHPLLNLKHLNNIIFIEENVNI